MPSPGDNVGSVGTITKDLSTGAVPTSTFNVSGDGFNYNPGYYRQQADGLGSMAPINWPDASKMTQFLLLLKQRVQLQVLGYKMQVL